MGHSWGTWGKKTTTVILFAFLVRRICRFYSTQNAKILAQTLHTHDFKKVQHIEPQQSLKNEGK